MLANKQQFEKHTMKALIIGAFILLAYFLSLPYCQAQKTDCPPGWEKHPGKHPECAGLNIPLPVTVISFKAIATGQTVLLKWQVALELNHSHYIIERSADGRQWLEIGQTTEYFLKDHQPAALNYYRLVSVDLDGTRNIYKTVAASVEAAGINWAMLPKNQILIINRQKFIIR